MKPFVSEKDCKCEGLKDLSNGYGPVRNFYCPDCQKHIYGDVTFNRRQWNAWINSDVCCKIRDGKLTVHLENGNEHPVTFEELMTLVNYENETILYPWMQ